MTLHVTTPVQQADTAIVDFWNAVLAPKFIKYRHIMVGGLSRHSAAVMGALDIPRDAHVLDVGCGFGDTAIEIANRHCPDGQVTGIDCCQTFLNHAWHAAEMSWTPNVRFARGDAEQGLEQRAYDYVFARFGTMFFTNPVRGLRAMRMALKPGGRIAHIVWRQRADNPWLNTPHQIVRGFLPAPGADGLNCGPGPFSMANEDTTRAQMEAAGFTDITFRRIDAKVLVGRDIDEAIAFQLAIGPAGETFREAGPLAEARRGEIEAALADLFTSVETTRDGLWMDSSSWLITARNPV